MSRVACRVQSTYFGSLGALRRLKRICFPICVLGLRILQLSHSLEPRLVLLFPWFEFVNHSIPICLDGLLQLDLCQLQSLSLCEFLLFLLLFQSRWLRRLAPVNVCSGCLEGRASGDNERLSWLLHLVVGILLILYLFWSELPRLGLILLQELLI